MIVGTGVDLCSVERMKRLYAKYGRKLAWRIMSPEEQNEAKISPGRLARRFAAKEAISKAFGVGIGGTLSFQDMTVLKNEKGQPYVILSEKAQRLFPNVFVHISISQEESMAVASALIVQRGPLTGE